MKMNIHNGRKLGELQSEFASCFPYLKIEFLKHPLAVGFTNIKKEIYPATARVGDVRNEGHDGDIDFSEDMTVAAFESTMKDVFGLYPQVFRHSGKVWLITTATDQWTLKMQNAEGKELSEGQHTERSREEIDYHDQE